MFKKVSGVLSRTKVIDSENNKQDIVDVSLIINTYILLIILPLILVAMGTYINFLDKTFNLDEALIDLKLALMFSGIIYTFLSTLIYRSINLILEEKITAKGFFVSSYFTKLPIVDKIEVLVYTVVSGILFFISPLLGLAFLILSIRMYSFEYNIKNYFTFLKIKLKNILVILKQSIILLISMIISIIYSSILYIHVLENKDKIDSILRLGDPNTYIYTLYVLSFVLILLLAANLIFILITTFTYNLRYSVDIIENNKMKGVIVDERE